MKLPINGPAYQHYVPDANTQRCLNWFLAPAGEGGIGDNVLVQTEGLSLLEDLGGNPMRCLETVGDYVYTVVGSSVYRLDINDGTETCDALLIGTLGTSSGNVSMASNPTQIMWVDGSTTGYIYTIASGVFETINSVDADFPGGGQVAFLGGYFITFVPGTATLWASALNNGKNWDPLDVATAESNTDPIVGLRVSKGDLWVIGTRTTEIWYNAGNPTGFPLSPRTGLELQIGCTSPWSIVQINDLLMWVDNRGYVVKSNVSPFVRSSNSGYTLDIVSTEVLSAEWLAYYRLDDAIAMTYNTRGHLMYQVTFPTAKKTWVYDYSTQVWHERSYYSVYETTHQHHLAQFYTRFGRLHLVGGLRNGKLYMSKPTYYTDNEAPIYRVRTTSPQREEKDAALIGVSSLELRLLSGYAPQGTNPQMVLRYSNNGGHTWSSALPRSIGRTGEYAKSITWNRLGTAREWVLEFTMSDAVNCSILSGTVQTTLEGG